MVRGWGRGVGVRVRCGGVVVLGRSGGDAAVCGVGGGDGAR